MTPEHRIQNEIRNALVDDCLLFRVNVGQAWTGDRITNLRDGRLLIEGPRPFNVGLPAGFSDTFGLVEVTITEAMVGSRLGQFLAGEIKTETGRVSPKQSAFLQAINNRGGRAGVWRSVDDALRMVRGAKGNM